MADQSIKTRLKKLRQKVSGLTFGKTITVDDVEFRILIPSRGKMEAWQSGDTNAQNEVLRQCIAEPKTELLLFEDATDKELEDVSGALVPYVTAIIVEVMEQTMGNFTQTANDGPSTK